MYSQERERLVLELLKYSYIRSERVQQAVLTVPRELFVPSFQRSRAYDDTPLEIGHGQTISAPHMVAIMCEELSLREGQKVLEIGAGSGYHAAIVSYLVGKKGHVYSIERIASLAKKAKENLSQVNIKNVTVEVGDGSLGLPNYQPYDRIYVTCAAPSVPQALLDQLSDTGKLLIPVGDMYCDLLLVEKKGSEITTHNRGGCVFVPLLGKYGHQKR